MRYLILYLISLTASASMLFTSAISTQAAPIHDGYPPPGLMGFAGVGIPADPGGGTGTYTLDTSAYSMRFGRGRQPLIRVHQALWL